MGTARTSAFRTEQRLELARHRQELLRCLVDLIEVDRDPEATADRRASLEKKLQALEGALERLLAKSSDVAASDGSAAGDVDEPTEPDSGAIEAILTTVRGLLANLPPDGDPRLEGFPDPLREPMVRFLNERYPVKKILIAVHGIGDQFNFETIQSVAYRVCDYVGQPAAIPLGRFHGTNATVTRAYLPDPDRDPAVNCGFAEIYWADVPRKPVGEKYILEEPRKWARTLVERLELRVQHSCQEHGEYTPAEKEKARHENDLLGQVIDEMIQGVDVADRLASLGEMAGLFRFDLKKLLVDYLNDVQVVTEFENYREDLLRIFRRVMETTHKFFPESELYIVAHSEGTVVAFMGMLDGLSAGAAWTGSLRGLMTIGSPLNKHVRLWPELFSRYKAPAIDPARIPIRWKNYYDRGDPIANNLEATRTWMADHGWGPLFAFRGRETDGPGESDDIGFTRYYFPGAAHNDYWRDPEVFGHFFQTVVDPERNHLDPVADRPFEAPRTIGLAWVTSYILPYMLSVSLLVLGIYLFYIAMRSFLDPIGSGMETMSTTAVNVLGLSALFAGTTVLARIPRLTRKPRYLLWVIPGLLASLGYLGISAENQVSVAQFLDITTDLPRWVPMALVAALAVASVALYWQLRHRPVREMPPWLRTIGPVLVTLLPVCIWYLLLGLAVSFLDRTNVADILEARVPVGRSLAVISIAWVIGLMSCLVSRKFPMIGLKPLLHTTALILTLVVLTQVFRSKNERDLTNLEPVVRIIHSQAVDLVDRLILYGEIAEESPKAQNTAGAAAVDLSLMERRREYLKERADLKKKIARIDQDGASGAEWDALREEIDSIDQKLMTEVPLPADRQQILLTAALHGVADAARQQGPLWPVALSGAVFLYLWWLATLMFDLAFIWHLYIKNEVAQNYIEHRLRPEVAGAAAGQDGPATAIPEPAGAR